jgi:hypothetical protein
LLLHVRLQPRKESGRADLILQTGLKNLTRCVSDPKETMGEASSFLIGGKRREIVGLSIVGNAPEAIEDIEDSGWPELSLLERARSVRQAGSGSTPAVQGKVDTMTARGLEAQCSEPPGIVGANGVMSKGRLNPTTQTPPS